MHGGRSGSVGCEETACGTEFIWIFGFSINIFSSRAVISVAFECDDYHVVFVEIKIEESNKKEIKISLVKY